MSAQSWRINNNEDSAGVQTNPGAWQSAPQHDEVTFDQGIPLNILGYEQYLSPYSRPLGVRDHPQACLPIPERPPYFPPGDLVLQRSLEPPFQPPQHTYYFQGEPTSFYHGVRLPASTYRPTAQLLPSYDQPNYDQNLTPAAHRSHLQAMTFSHIPDYNPSIPLGWMDASMQQPFEFGASSNYLSWDYPIEQRMYHDESEAVGAFPAANQPPMDSDGLQEPPVQAPEHIPVPEIFEASWLRASGIDEALLNSFHGGGTRMIWLYRGGAIRIDDRLQVEVEWLTESGKHNVTAYFEIYGSSKDALDFNFHIPAIDMHDRLDSVTSLRAMMDFMSGKGLTGRSLTKKRMAKDMHLFRGTEDLGSIKRVKKIYEYWQARQSHQKGGAPSSAQ